MPATPYLISGKITDSSSVAISNILVSIQNVSNNESSNVLTDSNGNYQYELASLTGYSIGNSISIYSSYGRNYKEFVFSTASSDYGVKTVNLSLTDTLTTSAVYCSVTDVRNFTNVSSSEFSDNQLMMFIRMATETIDQRTARTWKGIQTVTNELYNGDDTDILCLAHPDLQSVTAIAIDDDGDGVYTSITGNHWFIDNQDGFSTSMIVIDTINSNITNFTAGVNTCKISYTWGFGSPTEEIKLLAILMVANMINRTPERERDIDNRINRLAWSGPMRPV